MSTTTHEFFDSRSHSRIPFAGHTETSFGNRPLDFPESAQIQRKYITLQAADEPTLQAEINGLLEEGTIPDQIDYQDQEAGTLLSLQLINWNAEHVGSEVWRVTLEYGRRQAFRETLRTGGGRVRITQAVEDPNLSQITRVWNSGGELAGAQADLYQNVVEWDGKRVKGVTVQAPAYEFSEIHYRTRQTMNEGYRARLMLATGTINDSFFRGWFSGEVLFLGAYGKTVSPQWWEITYEFAVKLNRNQTTTETIRPLLDIGSIANVAARGWDHVWVSYKPSDITVGGTKYVLQIPDRVFVSPVYRSTNFFDLEIGTQVLTETQDG